LLEKGTRNSQALGLQIARLSQVRLVYFAHRITIRAIASRLQWSAITPTLLGSSAELARDLAVRKLSEPRRGGETGRFAEELNSRSVKPSGFHPKLSNPRPKLFGFGAELYGFRLKLSNPGPKLYGFGLKLFNPRVKLYGSGLKLYSFSPKLYSFRRVWGRYPRTGTSARANFI
jgi:hypothetical protein